MYFPIFLTVLNLLFKWARCTTIALKRVRNISLFPHTLYLLLGYSFKVVHEPFSLLQHIYPQLTIKPSLLHSGSHSLSASFSLPLSWSAIVPKAVCAIAICPPYQPHKHGEGGREKAHSIQALNSKLLLSVLASPISPPSFRRTRGPLKATIHFA